MYACIECACLMRVNGLMDGYMDGWSEGLINDADDDASMPRGLEGPRWEGII